VHYKLKCGNYTFPVPARLSAAQERSRCSVPAFLPRAFWLYSRKSRMSVYLHVREQRLSQAFSSEAENSFRNIATRSSRSTFALSKFESGRVSSESIIDSTALTRFFQTPENLSARDAKYTYERVSAPVSFARADPRGNIISLDFDGQQIGSTRSCKFLHCIVL